MAQGIAEVLPFAIGVAIVPIPIVAVIVMLFSQRANVNGPVFLLAWVAGLAAAVAVVHLVVGTASQAAQSSSDDVSWSHLVLGVVLLALAAHAWHKRPPAGTTPELPHWVTRADTIAPRGAAALGVALAALNPKNLMLVVGASVGLARLDLPATDTVAALVVFVVVGSIGVGVPVIYARLGGERAAARLARLRTWLAMHTQTVMAVLFLVFGIVVLARGLTPLIG